MSSEPTLGKRAVGPLESAHVLNELPMMWVGVVDVKTWTRRQWRW